MVPIQERELLAQPILEAVAVAPDIPALLWLVPQAALASSLSNTQ
jgi:hypothetical protein